MTVSSSLDRTSEEPEPVQATKECRRCGQVMPAECEPDGCRDPNCPEAK